MNDVEVLKGTWWKVRQDKKWVIFESSHYQFTLTPDETIRIASEMMEAASKAKQQEAGQ